jgi:hypothetical protein
MLYQESPIIANPFQQILFLVVVRDQRDPLLRLHRYRLLSHA